MKSGKIENVLVSLICLYLVGRVKKWENKKLFCQVQKKNEIIKNVIFINLLLYPYYIIHETIFLSI